jgi:hypothetical protein
MRLTQILTAENSLLDYAMLTNPDPLNVGSPAILTFVVSAPKSLGKASVSQITFVLPVGDPANPDPTDLTNTPPPASCASIASSGPDAWTIAAGVADGVFVATPPAGGGTLGAESLTVMFTGIAINALVGTAVIEIAEWASSTGPTPSPSDPPTGTTAIAAAKFPAAFYAGNFSAAPPQVSDGGSATLSWIGSVEGSYKIYSGQNPPVDVSDKRSWPTPALTDVTSFVLEASAQDGGQTVYLYFNTTVAVSQPSVVASDLTVLTTSALNGAVTVGTGSAPANLTVNGGMGASGSVTADSATIANTATVGALTTAGQVSANTVQTNSLNSGSATLGSTTVNGLNAAQGAVKTMGGAQSLTPGPFNAPQAYLPPTDGFVMCTIQGPRDYPTGGCMAWTAISQQGMIVYNTGGNVGFFGPSWDDCMGNNLTSSMMPVVANQYFYLYAQQGDGDCQQTDATWNFWFVPMGAGAADTVAREAPEAPPMALPMTGDKKRRDWEAPKEFVAVLETLLTKPIDPATRQQMIDVIHRM